mgnify:CR=1 FL=1
MSEEIPAGGPYKAATGRHESLSADSIKRVRKLWALYCSAEGEYCERFRDVIMRSSALIAKARLEELTSSYTGIDSGIIKAFERLSDIYGKYLSGAVIAKGEKVLVTSKASVSLPNGLALAEGDVLFLDVSLAAPLFAAGLVEPVLTWSVAASYLFSSAKV